MMELADQRIANLDRELNTVKEENVQQSKIIASLKNQVYGDHLECVYSLSLSLLCVQLSWFV